MRELIERYEWVQRRDVVLTLAIISGTTEGDVVRSYGGDPGRGELMTMAEAEDAGLEDTDNFYFQVFEHGESVVALENNGWSGTVPGIARRTSVDDGHFFSVHWNVNGMFRITEAVDGKVTAYFELMSGDGPTAPDDVIPEWLGGTDFDSRQLRAMCLALVETRTGVVVEPQWFTARLSTYRIPDPDVLLADVENLRTP